MERLDVWWNKILETKRYPILSSLVKASLSIFAGPKVERSFSMMNDIIDSRSGRTEIDTYSVIMTVKYQLKSAGVTVLIKFHRKDNLRGPVDGSVCYYIRTACSRYKKRLASKREVMLQRQRKLTTKKNPKIKGAKKKSKVHEKVTVKSAFYFYNFIRQSYLSFS